MNESWDIGVGHFVTVAKLRELLLELRDDDVLTPNRVENLTVLRGGEREQTKGNFSVLKNSRYVGFIDLLNGDPHVELFEEDLGS
jgi:hypothetical protein